MSIFFLTGILTSIKTRFSFVIIKYISTLFFVFCFRRIVAKIKFLPKSRELISSSSKQHKPERNMIWKRKQCNFLIIFNEINVISCSCCLSACFNKLLDTVQILFAFHEWYYQPANSCGRNCVFATFCFADKRLIATKAITKISQ